jgi:hypothetical protein
MGVLPPRESLRKNSDVLNADMGGVIFLVLPLFMEVRVFQPFDPFFRDIVLRVEGRDHYRTGRSHGFQQGIDDGVCPAVHLPHSTHGGMYDKRVSLTNAEVLKVLQNALFTPHEIAPKRPE